MQSRRDRLQAAAVLAPSAALMLVFIYGFILFTFYLSFTDSKLLPSYNWVGLENYQKLFNLRNWKIALSNLWLFSLLYIVTCTALGLLLAILVDQHLRGEALIRPIYLYPMAISFIVTGTAWKWFLDPGIGLERIVQSWGFDEFTFNWIKDSKRAIYVVVIAAVWQSSGFIMAMFLAGLRGINTEILHAARIDGASGFRLYWRIVIPQLRLVFLSAFVILAHLAIKSYDLVIALTGGGPGRATELPSTFMYSYTFTRNAMGIGAAAAIVMLLMVAAIIIPYLTAEVRRGKQSPS